MLEIQHLK